MKPTDLPPAVAVTISREALEEFDELHVNDMSRVDMAYWLGQLSAAVRALLAHAEPSTDIDDGPCVCDHHGDHAGCGADCECAR